MAQNLSQSHTETDEKINWCFCRFVQIGKKVLGKNVQKTTRERVLPCRIVVLSLTGTLQSQI